MQISGKQIKVILGVVALLGGLWKVSDYLQQDHFIGVANAQRMDKIEEKESKDDTRWEEINHRLSHIEGVLEEMRRDESWQ